MRARVAAQDDAEEHRAEDRPSLVAAARGRLPITIDGALDEAAWAQAPVADGFVERSPNPGAVPPVDTRFRVLYDEGALYVGIECDLLPGEHPRALELRRDSFNIYSDDALTVKVDVAHDRRTTIGFAVNPANTQVDYVAIDNGRQFRREYDAVWESATHVGERSWVAELRIPMTALGIPGGSGERVLGLNVTRDHNARFATDDWSHLPPALGAVSALNYGDLRGVYVGGGAPLTVIPYGLVGWATPGPGEPFEANGRLSAGGDARLRISEDAWGELTVLTDFAQVDLDDQVVNLNRFPIFYPERRPFFINGLDIFEFGSEGASQLFFSRRIGLDADRETVPMWGGVKLYGHAGPIGFGLLDVATGDPNQNWGVARLRGNVGEAGYIGAMFTAANGIDVATDAGYAAGVDTTLRFLEGEKLELTGSLAATDLALDSSLNGWNHASGTAKVRYRDLNFRPSLSFLYVGDDYDPPVGFVRRRGVATTSLDIPVIAYPDLFDLQSVTLSASGSLVRSDELREDLGGAASGYFSVDWPSWGFDMNAGYVEDIVTEGFDLLGKIPVAPGAYDGATVDYSIYASSQLNPYGSLGYSASNAFFGGVIHTLNASGGVALGPHFRIAASVRQSFVRIPGYAEEHALTVNSTITIAPSTLLTADLIVQLNDLNERTTGLLRVRWRYLPGSDLFFVYRQELPYDCYRDGLSCQANTELTLKVSYRFDALL